MFQDLSAVIASLKQTSLFDGLKKIRRGIEKESLRIDPSGNLSQKPHPQALGSAFTHKSITTDFSESLIEFITSPFDTVESALKELQYLHQFTVRHLDDELLWPCSMPCLLTPDNEIPLAYYGRSNLARMKTVYRAGLGLRYGRAMQMITGVHYNFSFEADFLKNLWQQLGRPACADPVSEAYFAMIRNYHRISWIVPYLFGASPVVCSSFFTHESHRFPLQDKEKYANPYAISLRLSDIGYKNRTAEKIEVSYDNLEAYVASLKKALTTVDPHFAALGVKRGEEWLQLNANIIQIEAEYYGSIRPKRIPRALERVVHALQDRGVEYVEIRTLDLNPFSPIGIDEYAPHFLDCLLLACVLTESPLLSATEQKINTENLKRIVNEGRKPGLTLLSDGDEQTVSEWSERYLRPLLDCADLLDTALNTNAYGLAMTEIKRRFSDQMRLPSYRLLDEIQAKDGSFLKAGLALARAHTDTLKAIPLPSEIAHTLEAVAKGSWRQHQGIEALPEPSFESFLAHYFNSERI